MAECIPRLPTCGFPSVETGAPSESSDGGDAPLGLLSCEVGTRCWTMVEFTANLWVGAAFWGVDSEITALRMEFCDRSVCYSPVLLLPIAGRAGWARD